MGQGCARLERLLALATTRRHENDLRQAMRVLWWGRPHMQAHSRARDYAPRSSAQLVGGRCIVTAARRVAARLHAAAARTAREAGSARGGTVTAQQLGFFNGLCILILCKLRKDIHTIEPVLLRYCTFHTFEQSGIVRLKRDSWDCAVHIAVRARLPGSQIFVSW